MEPRPPTARASGAIDALVQAPSPQARVRTLVDAALQSAGAVALWRWSGGCWRPLLARGRARSLPSPSAVEQVALGELPAELGQRLVIARRPFALALGEVAPGEEVREELEALFDLWRCLDAADPLDGPLGPLPEA